MDSELKELKSFIMDSKHTSPLLQRETFSLFYWKLVISSFQVCEKTSSFLQHEILSLPSKAVCHRNILEKIFQNKGTYLVCLFTRCAKGEQEEGGDGHY